MASVSLVTASPQVSGVDWVAVVTWTGDSSYLAEGELLTLQECGFGKEAVFKYAVTNYVENLTEQAVYRPTTAKYDGAKVHVFDDATGKELASTKDISKFKAQFEIHCSSN